VTIFSLTIAAIKNETRQLTEVQEMFTLPANVYLMNDKPEKDDTRQGETPEVNPHGVALPL
jgi:hypothetical protein